MSPPQAVAVTAAELAACLPRIGDALQTQLETLSTAPSIEEVAAVAANLASAHHALLRLAGALKREERSHAG